MQMKNNYLAVVSLGCFNPAILTPLFLKEQCGFQAHADAQGRTTPVASVINFGSISFVLDLERFVIKHSDIEDFTKSDIVSVMMKYLSVLKYTPVRATGINLNYDILAPDIADVRKKLSERSNHLFDVVGLEQAVMTFKEQQNKDGQRRLVEFEVAGDVDENTTERLKITLKDGAIQVNHNHEIKNLDQNPKLIERLEPDLQSFVQADLEMSKTLFKEQK